MGIAENEAVACVRILVALMKADGTIDPNERKSLVAAVHSLELGERISVAGLLEEDVNIDEELSRIASPEACETTYRAACYMVHADGKLRPSELALLERITVSTKPSDEDRTRIARALQTPSKGKVAAFVDALSGMFRSEPRLPS